MRTAVVGLVPPHLLRIFDLANEAVKGVNVDLRVRNALAHAIVDLGDRYNASTSMSASVAGLESPPAEVPKHRADYARVLRAAAEAARRLNRD